MQEHQARMHFEKRRQYADETINNFLDDLEMLIRRNQPDESNCSMSLAVASKSIDGVKNDEHRTILLSHYPPPSTNAPTPEKRGLKSNKYLLLKPPIKSVITKTLKAVLTIELQTKVTTGTSPGMTWKGDGLAQTAVPQTIMY